MWCVRPLARGHGGPQTGRPHSKCVTQVLRLAIPGVRDQWGGGPGCSEAGRMMACAHPGGCVRFRMASRAGGREGALQGPPAPPSGPTAAWRRRKAAQQHSGHAPGGVEGAAGTRRAGRAGRQRGKRSSAPGHRALAVRVSPHQAPFHSSLSPTKTHRRAAREALWATGVVDLSREADTMAAGGWRLGEREARREGREAKRETRCE